MLECHSIQGVSPHHAQCPWDLLWIHHGLYQDGAVTADNRMTVDLVAKLLPMPA